MSDFLEKLESVKEAQTKAWNTPPTREEGQSLKNYLFTRRNYELSKLKERWEMEGSKGKPPSALPPLLVANILLEVVSFALIGEADSVNLAYYNEQTGLYDFNELQLFKMISWLEITLNENKTKDVVFHIKKQTNIKIPNNNPDWIPVNNGIYNKKTHELMPYDPKHIFLSKIATNYNEHATSPKIDNWDVDSWIAEISNYDKEVELLLWQVIADSIQGNYSRQKSIWLYGETGANGKGTFQELIINLVGKENVAILRVNDFTDQKKFRLAELVGAVCCIGDDNDPNQFIDTTANYKGAVTGEYLLIERKHKAPFSFKYQGSVIQSMNGYPKIKDTTGGFLRRLVIVPFLKTYRGSENNWKIKQKYIKNKRVLEYVLKRALELDFDKFIEPEVTKEALKEFAQENDSVQEFVNELLPLFVSARIPLDYLYSLYKAYSQENNPTTRCMSRTAFTRRIKPLVAPDWDYDNFRLSYFFNQEEENNTFSDYIIDPFNIYPLNKVYRGIKNQERETEMTKQQAVEDLEEACTIISQKKRTLDPKALIDDYSYLEAKRQKEKSLNVLKEMGALSTIEEIQRLFENKGE